MKPKVSIIVPIYNCEKYLDEAIQSLLNQSIKECEFILVNDGSTDNSLNIANEYKKLDSRIKIINQVNQGVSVARNTGIEASQGEYIGFIDGDVKLLEPKENVKIPHIGWNKLECNRENNLLKGLAENSFVYYVHSYAASNVKDENLIGFSNYGAIKVPSIVCKGNVYGTQFHPEKSGEVGLKILKNFGEVIK